MDKWRMQQCQCCHVPSHVAWAIGRRRRDKQQFLNVDRESVWTLHPPHTRTVSPIVALKLGEWSTQRTGIHQINTSARNNNVP